MIKTKEETEKLIWAEFGTTQTDIPRAVPNQACVGSSWTEISVQRRPLSQVWAELSAVSVGPRFQPRQTGRVFSGTPRQADRGWPGWISSGGPSLEPGSRVSDLTKVVTSAGHRSCACTAGRDEQPWLGLHASFTYTCIHVHMHSRTHALFAYVHGRPGFLWFG